jgi:glycosyltransferase involved in cell wall biosynthesis
VRLDAAWIPNVADHLEPLNPPADPYDLLFFGNLSYLPNIAAVERLSRMWPRLVDRRPDISVLIAGARPTPEVRRICALHGWDLNANFRSLPLLTAQARLAVVPIDHATGVQNKVLDAASLGLPQVVTPAVMAGLDEAFPALIAHTDEDFVDSVVRLLEDPHHRAVLALAGRAHVGTEYSAARWASRVRGLLEEA